MRGEARVEREVVEQVAHLALRGPAQAAVHGQCPQIELAGLRGARADELVRDVVDVERQLDAKRGGIAAGSAFGL